MNRWDVTFEDDSNILTAEEFNHGKDHLKGLINDIYVTGNIEDLEFHLEELLYIFDLKIPQSSPRLVSPSTNTQPNTREMLNAWVGFNQDYAKQLCQNS